MAYKDLTTGEKKVMDFVAMRASKDLRIFMHEALERAREKAQKSMSPRMVKLLASAKAKLGDDSEEIGGVKMKVLRSVSSSSESDQVETWNSIKEVL